MTLKIKVESQGITDQALAELPITMREKWLKKALRVAARTVAKEVARRAPEGDEDGFDTVANAKPLKASIRGRTVNKGPQRIAGRVETYGFANTYAAAVEYGHEVVLPGRIRTGEVLPGEPYFRPAVDSTRHATERMIVRELRRGLAEVERSNRGLRG